MNYRAIVVIAGWLLSVYVSVAEPMLGRPRPKNNGGVENWPLVELNLSDKPTLKEIFDSGLRPYRFPAMESGLLEAKHFRVLLKIEGQRRLPVFPVEYCGLRVLKSGHISNLEFTSPQLDFSDSANLFTPWLQFSDRTPKELDLFFETVKANPAYWRSQTKNEMVSGGCAVVWEAFGGSRKEKSVPAFISFLPTFSGNKPLRLRLGFRLSNAMPMSRREYYRVPIPPPPGYEHVDMTAPKNFGPDSAVNILKSQGYDIGDGGDGKPLLGSGVEAQKEPRKSSRKPKEKLEIQEPESEPTRSKWPIILAILLVIGGLLAWFRSRSKKS